MGRILAPCPLLHRGTAVLQLCNGLCEIGDDFHLLLVCCNQLVNCIILLDGGVCQVVEQCCHLLCLDNSLCSCLIGKGGVAGCHAADVAHFCKCGRPVIFPVVCVCACPPVIRGDTVKHALTSTSSPPNDIPYIPWSPIVLPL
jgi:hypothetical protein